MREIPPQNAASVGTRAWLCALGAALASGCATGVEVTEGELAAICSESGINCGPAAPGTGSGGTPSTGGSGSGTAGANVGGTGTGTTGGSFGVGAAGTPVSPVGSGGSGVGGTAAGGSASGGTGSVGAPTPGECLVASDVVILYRDRREGALSANEPSMVLSLENTGAPFDLSQLTIRYWFTADGGSNFTGNVDYATLDGQQGLGGQVQLSFGQDLGSDYVELAFGGGGSVQDGIQEVQLRFHADGYPDLDQTNDFSFLRDASQLTENPNITPYLSGSQVGGCVPAF